jgi:8-oxo-dGTP pyrophosphatase MutT (NUDIX family)
MAIEVLGAGDPRLDPRADLATARAQIEAYAPTTIQQQRLRHETLTFIDGHDDALLRTCHEGHLTGSALVIDATSEHVVLLLHRKAQRWLQPGGHADGDANLAGVAWREATEETGIVGLRVVTPIVDLDIHRVHFAGEHAHLHLDARFVVRAPVGSEPIGNDESEVVRWVAVDDLESYDLDRGTIRLARAALERAANLVPEH